MKVFKFGGASVKSADAVRNVMQILKRYPQDKLTVVVSAMGKTTNALERVVKALWEKNEVSLGAEIAELRSFHQEILAQLFAENAPAHLLDELESNIRQFENTTDKSFDFLYDQIVSQGEVLSTKIIVEFLKKEGLRAQWADARTLVQTNHKFREGEVDWRTTEEQIKTQFIPHFDLVDIQVTQGFIGHTSDGHTTTLGREGSDYTAGIFAFCTEAEDVTIWKDVPGMLNADPKYFSDTVKLDKISFKEAIELSYYGASVIHPKTVKPLQNREIPLYVRSFINPEKEGTVIQSGESQDHLIPSFIFKMEQVLVSFAARDFSFIVEEHLSDIFNRLARANAKINLMQNSALNFSVLLDQEKINLRELIGLFENTYTVKFNEDLELVTIRHYDQKTIDRVTVGKKILVEQKTRETARLVLQNAE